MKNTSPILRYKLSAEMVPIFAPLTQDLHLHRFQTGGPERERQFHLCCNTLLRPFGVHTTYAARSWFPARAPLCKKRLRDLKDQFDFMSVHWWDPITGKRTRILTHFSDKSALLREGTTPRAAIARYRRIEAIYIRLTESQPGGTLVQSIAGTAHRLPVTLVLWHDELPMPSVACPIRSYGFPFKILTFPLHTIRTLLKKTNFFEFSAHLGDARRADAAAARILSILQQPPYRLLDHPGIAGFRDALSPLVDDLPEERLWSILGGLGLWHLCLGLLPYTLVLFPIPVAPTAHKPPEPLYFALSASAPTQSTAANLERLLIDASGRLAQLGDAATSALCGTAPALRDLWEYEHLTVQFYQHEVGIELTHYEQWLSSALHQLPVEARTGTPYGLGAHLKNTLHLFSDHTNTGSAWGAHPGSPSQFSVTGECSWSDLIPSLVYATIAPGELQRANQRFFYQLETPTGPYRVSFRDAVMTDTVLSLAHQWPPIGLKYSIVQCVIRNLLRNAAVFVTQGPIEVRVRFGEAPGYVDIGILDHGAPFLKSDTDVGMGLRFIEWVMSLLRDRDQHREADLLYPIAGQTPKEFVARMPLRSEC